MPTTVGNRILRVPEAQLLSDLYGIEIDLGNAIEFCDLLLNAWGSTPPTIQLIDPLSTAAVVRYARCFEGGVRTRLTEEDIRAIDPSWVDFHQKMFFLRQKHLAHSVNEFEENRVTVSVVEPPGPPKVHSIGMLGGRLMGLDADTAQALKELAELVRAEVSRRIDREKTRLQALVDAMPVEAVHELPEAVAFLPDWSRIKESRSRT